MSTVKVMKFNIPALPVAMLALVAMLLSAAPGRAADAGAWTLVESSGGVHVTFSGVRPVALTTGDEVGPGRKVTTDADGRAVLRRGKSTIVVSPNSALEVPADKADTMMTRVRHLVGTLLFDVDKRKEEHFEVLTPDVAVVVKGTTFTTSVGAQGAVVHVISGLVQVADVRSGQAVFIRPGQTATSPKGGGDLQVRGEATGAPAGTGASGKSAEKKAAAQDGGNGARIGQMITGKTQSLAQLSGGLLHQEGARGVGAENGKGLKVGLNPIGGNAIQNPGGNVPQGVAVGLTGNTPPGLVGNSNAHGGNPNAGGGNPNAGGGNPNAGGGNPNAGGKGKN